MTPRRRTGTPARVVTAAVLCGLVGLPMLAAAGSLAGRATTETGPAATLQALLALALLAAAGAHLTGAVHLLRGTARVAQLAGCLTIGISAVMLAAALAGVPSGAPPLAAPLFLAPVIVMLTLLGTRRARLWLAARGRAFELAATRRPVRSTR